MNIYPYRLSFILTATGMLLGIAGLLLPAAFGSAPAQTPAPQATIMQLPAVPPSATDQQTQDTPIPAVDRRDPFIPDATSAPVEIQTDTVVTSQRFIAVPATLIGNSAPEPKHDDFTGIIVGEHPYALVNMGGKTRLLSIGDTFQGRKITTITMRGVALDDHSIAHIPLMDQ